MEAYTPPFLPRCIIICFDTITAKVHVILCVEMLISHTKKALKTHKKPRALKRQKKAAYFLPWHGVEKYTRARKNTVRYP